MYSWCCCNEHTLIPELYLHFWQPINRIFQEHTALLEKADFPPRKVFATLSVSIFFALSLFHLLWWWEILNGMVFLFNFDISVLLLIVLLLLILFPLPLVVTCALHSSVFQDDLTLFVKHYFFYFSLVDLHNFLKVIFFSFSLIYLSYSHFCQLWWSFGQPAFYFLEWYSLAVLNLLLPFQHL